MRIFSYLLIAVLAFAIGINAVNTDDPICGCSTCCNVANETSTHFTGKSIVQFTYPSVSYDGSYTVIGHRYNEGQGRLLAEVVDSLPYQYVVKYENEFKDSFDRNILVFATIDDNLNCTESHLYYGNEVNDTFKKIDFVKHDTEDYCTLDIHYQLTRDEIAFTDEIYFAFNHLVDEQSDFNIMYDLTPQGLIVPANDINEYPYMIEDGTVTAIDINEASAFYIDVGLDVLDISTLEPTEDAGTGCLDIDGLFNNSNAYWLTKTGGKCDVDLISGGVGNATDGGRNYHLRIDQTYYQTCAVKDVELLDGNLTFTFRLVLPRDHTDTTEDTDTDGCFYFGENENVQNITISMSQDVSAEIDANFISNFNTRIVSVAPDTSDTSDPTEYPTPYAKIKFTIEATFPSTFGNDFSSITLPTLEGLVVEWDTVTGAAPSVIPCTDYTGEDLVLGLDDYRVCQFNLITQTAEPIYTTTDDRCAFERNNTRLLSGFVVVEEMPGGQLATYPAGDLNLGLDNLDFAPELCAAAAEDAAINVVDVFNVELDLQNYYAGAAVDWTETDNYTMNEDMILRLKVGEIASSPFTFDDDLQLMIKTVNVELSNPVTNDIITSYTWSPGEKADFMDYSWTPYHDDPRFCTWYNSIATDKCEKFFVEGTRDNSFHDATWINDTMPLECQETGFLSGQGTNNNNDFFLFEPREWFQDNAKGLVDMKVSVTGIIHKCSANPSRLLDAVNEGKIRGNARHATTLNPERDVLYVSKDLVISFVTKDDGDSHIEVSNIPQVSWFEENKTLVIVASSLAGIVVLGFFVVALGRNKHYHGLIAVGGSANPDF